MRVQTLTISLLLSTSLSGLSAGGGAAAVPAAPAPAFRPAPPAVLPPAPVTPSTAPGLPSTAPAQLPPVQSGPTFSGTNGNPVAAQLMATNGMAAQFANTNGLGLGTNQFGAGLNAGGVSNPAGIANPLAGSNQLGFHFTNQFGTNFVLQDEGLTPQDRLLVGQIRKELLPIILRDQLPLHLASQNGVVTLVGVALSAQEAQQLAVIVQQTPGVTGVRNQLRVNPNFAGHGEVGEWAREPDRGDEAFSDHDRDLLRDIRGRMRHRQEEGGAGASESVRIIARNGVIELTGFVGSAAEEQALVAAAQSTPGVVRVDNDLQVRGQPSATGLGGASSPSGVSSGADYSSTGAVERLPVPRNGFGGSLTNTLTNTLSR